MKTANTLVLSSAIGALAGLRAFTPLAIVSRASYHHFLRLRRSPVSWMGSSAAATILPLAAGGELVGDKLPATPNRTDAGPMIARMVSGAICGMAIASSRSRRSPQPNHPGLLTAAAICGGLGAVAGTLAGYHLRHQLTVGMGVPDAAVAIVEDGIAIGGSIAAVRASGSLVSIATRGIL